MKLHRKLLLAAALLLAASSGFAQQDAPKDAPRVDPKYVWDLTEIYPTAEAWDQARKEVLASTESILALRGTLGESADSLYRALSLVSDTSRKAARVHAWASLHADEDVRVTETQERRELALAMFARLGEATAWMQPEILRVGEETIDSFLAADERLDRFAFQLHNSLRNAPHTLGDEAEQALSYFAQSMAAPNTIYDMFAYSDIPWPTITLSNGDQVQIDAQGYTRVRSSQNRADRKAAFDAYWGEWKDYRAGVGSILNSHLQNQVALAKARKYDSVLERELFEDNLPPAVYHTLVEEVNKALPTLHRYLKLRARMLGIDDLRYYDSYPSLVTLDKNFDIETSKQITLDAMSILGKDWVDMQREAMNERWMHVYPQRGKASGAYMNPSAFDVHPYLLLNHNDDYYSLSTLAHEWGHAMHTLYAKQAQPFETADYATFIAEIPSTSLELILRDYLFKHAETDQERMFYLGSSLESLRTTFFRQTMFAEFELALYQAVERGEALSGERISEMYGEILKRYHGQDQGIMTIDDLYTNEWMFVPHFYYNMYVFQYATSQTAGTALYEKIVEEGEPGVENYKNLLRAGGSDYPYKLLLNAGVDLAKPEPYQAVVTKMNAVMDEMEAILARQSQ